MGLMDDLRAAIGQAKDERLEFLKAADLLTSDFSSSVEIRFADAVLLYGSYATPLVNRLAHTKSLATTHYWLEAEVRDSTSNAANEGSTPTQRSKVPSKKSNTCQIVSGMVEPSGSAIQEAQNGIYGPGLQNLVEFQAMAEMAGIIKDIEAAILTGTESTSDPRAMWGLANLSGINTTDGSGAAIGTAILDEAIVESYEDSKMPPTAIYCPVRTAGELATMASGKVQINLNVTPENIADAMKRLPAGHAIGFYMSQFGPLDIVPTPELAYSSGTAASNILYVVTENLLRIADFRPLHRTPWTTELDALRAAIIWEGTFEAKAPDAHNKVSNWLHAADV